MKHVPKSKRLAGWLVISLVMPATLVAQEASRGGSSESEIIVPTGTTLPIVMSTYLNTRSSQAGDSFYADTLYPIWIQQRLVIPSGSTIKGTVTHVKRPGKIKGKGRLSIRFDTVVLPNGVTRKLVAVLQGIHGPGEEKLDRRTETVEMDSSKGKDTGSIVGTSTQGAIIGAIAGDGRGAGIGAGIGGAIGLATVLFTRGKELVLQPGTQFDLGLRQPLHFAYAELLFTGNQTRNAARPAGRAPRYNRDHNHSKGPSGFPGRFPTPWPWP